MKRIRLYLALYAATVPLGYHFIKLSGPPLQTLADQAQLTLISLVWPFTLPMVFLDYKAKRLAPLW